MTHPYRIGDSFSDGREHFDERYVCNHCREQHQNDRTPFAWADTRLSFGCYAGRYCDDCWTLSGFRDATDPTATFDELDAGERIEELD